MKLLDIVDMDPDRLPHFPIIHGTRIPIKFILDLLDAGAGAEDVVEIFPDININVALLIYSNRNFFEKCLKALKLISVRRNILCGIPTIKGTRIPVYIVYDMLDSGYSPHDILEEYPELSLSTIKGLIKYRDILEPLVRRIRKRVLGENE